MRHSARWAIVIALRGSDARPVDSTAGCRHPAAQAMASARDKRPEDGPGTKDQALMTRLYENKSRSSIGRGTWIGAHQYSSVFGSSPHRTRPYSSIPVGACMTA